MNLCIVVTKDMHMAHVHFDTVVVSCRLQGGSCSDLKACGSSPAP